MSRSQRPAPGTTYPKGIKRRQEILDRTLEVLTSRGLEGVTLRAIAEEIGVAHTALHYYFPTREALLIEVLQQWEATYPDRRDEPLTAAIQRSAEYNSRVPGYVSLYTSLLGDAMESNKTATREYFTARFATTRADLAARLRTETGTSDHEARTLAALILAAMDGLQAQWILDPTVDMQSALELLGSLTSSPRTSA